MNAQRLTAGSRSCCTTHTPIPTRMNYKPSQAKRLSKLSNQQQSNPPNIAAHPSIHPSISPRPPTPFPHPSSEHTYATRNQSQINEPPKSLVRCSTTVGRPFPPQEKP